MAKAQTDWLSQLPTLLGRVQRNKASSFDRGKDPQQGNLSVQRVQV